VFKLSNRSLKNLVGVHPDLVRVVHRAITLTTVDFVVGEGVRTLETQRKYVAAGVSWTMKSRHLTGHAVDLWAYLGTVRWEEPLYIPIAKAMKAAAKAEGVTIQWGFDLWKKDSPHFQLPWKSYPV